MVDVLDIRIQKAKQSRLKEVNVNDLPFGKVFSDHMFSIDYKNGEWTDARIEPYGPISFTPAMSAIHYGQTLFEGLKAFKNDQGDVLLFRPLENLKRLNRTAERMCMPQIPEEIFMSALTTLLKVDKDWVFANDGCSLYIRPVMFSTDEFLGVRSSESYKFVILTSPTGPYFNQPVKVLIETHYSRACEGGVGYAKVAGNYGVSLYPTKLAQEKGYHQLIWTDAKEHKYIEESGMMNVMFVIGDTLVTPTIKSNTILVGKTRDSLLQIARDFGMKVEERRVSVEEIFVALQNGTLKEAFGVGTAATVAPIAVIGFEGKDHSLPTLGDSSFARCAAKHLTDIRKGKADDKHGWVQKVV